MNNKQILDKLLEKTLEIPNISKRNFESSGDFYEKHTYKAQYYFKNYKDNIYKPSKKMKLDANHSKAIYHSAVMIFNLLGEKVNWEQNDYNVTYEVELEALQNARQANVDFLMKNDSRLIFGEAKMTEWMNDPKKLKEAYLKKEKFKTVEEANFIGIFKEFIESKKGDGYKSKYKKYDAFQMLIHSLGIYRYVREGRNNGIKDIQLVNVVWESKENQSYKKEEEEAKDFEIKANKILKPIFKKYNVNFEIKYYTYHEFKSKIKFDDINREKYLKRYDID